MTLKKSQTTLLLNTGAKIPQIALGTWLSSSNDCYNAVISALKSGYRHIDTATYYLNEEQVGKAIKDSGIPRNEIFVTSKLWNTQQRDPKKALDLSLERLGLDYVDLYLMHWPVPFISDESVSFNDNLKNSTEVDKDWNFLKTWQLMQELPLNKVKAIGVSNFSINSFIKLFSSPLTKIIPAVNQVELHPLLPQDELIEFCKDNNIIVEAYSPLGSPDSPYWNNEVIKELTEKYNASIAQLLISWGTKRGYVVLPKSSNPKRIESNLEIIDLKEEDFKKISNLFKTEGILRITNPQWGNFNIFD